MEKYLIHKGLEEEEKAEVVEKEYHVDTNGMNPRYYQQNAINRTVEASAHEQNRILLVMATGTGKTYTAFNIIWRLWKAGVKKRILFQANRNALLSQTKNGDFSPFGNDIMHIIKNRKIDKSYQIYFALYQGLTSNDDPVSPPDYRDDGDEDDGWNTGVGDPGPVGEGDEEEGYEPQKYYVNHIPVAVSYERVQYYGADGKLITESLKDGGRCAVVLPDGTLFGEGVKTRIKEELLQRCNLHTIVRLPNGVFNPYTGIKTNLLFFEKGTPTKDIWYFEHPYPGIMQSRSGNFYQSYDF